MKFKSIMSGNFGPIAVNRRFRELYTSIDELEKRIEKLEKAKKASKKAPAKKAPTSTANSAETVIVD